MIDFYFDIVCPFAYMASTRIEALAAEAGVRVRWHPILLGGVFRSIGQADAPATEWSPTRQRVNELDIGRSAEHFGVPLERPPAHPRRTVDVMRLLVAAPEAALRPLARAFFEAYWVHGRDISDPTVYGALARAHGVDPALAQDPAVKKRLFEVTDLAVARGVFGVPTFFVGDEMFWGTDRLVLVRKAFGLPAGLLPPPRATGAKVVFFHDFSSPFSYLAATQIDRIAQDNDATVEWCPILLGALFKRIGTPDVPIFAMNPPRQRYFMKDMVDWAHTWEVPFRFPRIFPLRSVEALRVVIAEPKSALPLYRAFWAEQHDISQRDVIEGVLDDAGFDGRMLLERTQDPAIKDQLRANTARAEAVGACGVPSFLVDDVLFWGQDRMDQVVSALQGWRPTRG